MINPKLLEVTQLEDEHGNVDQKQENVHGGVVGLTVDYLSRLALRRTPNAEELSFQAILNANVESGNIYALQSMSTDPLIANMTDLHKIGFSTTSVEQRVRGALTSPTYLVAPVKIVADYRRYNVKASVLERLLNRVFTDVRLYLTQVDMKGKNYNPSEWFIVPRDVINKAVAMIMSGEITDYMYDIAAQQLDLTRCG